MTRGARGWQLDTDVPVILCKVGDYRIHHGGLGLARSLGRRGVPVAAMVEDPWTPLARSRYVRWPIPALPLGSPGEDLVTALADAVDQIGRRPIVAATDDDAAALVDEQGPQLEHLVRACAQKPGSSRRLSSKAGLAELCRELGFPTPLTCTVGEHDLDEFLSVARFPVIAKSRAAPGSGATGPSRATALLGSPAEVEQWIVRQASDAEVVLQEFLASDVRENWIYQAYRATNSDALVSFTGVKLRDWPVGHGETTLAQSRLDPRLRGMCDDLLRAIDYRGVCDLDLLRDTRSGQFHLIDFNPRFGANAATFRTEEGLDLVSAYHLDLSGREVPGGRQVDGVRFVVEVGDRRAREDAGAARPRGALRAYLARDDPLPAALAQIRGGSGPTRHVLGWARRALAARSPGTSGAGQ